MITCFKNKNTVYAAENKEYRIQILYDDSPENPRDSENLGTMVCWHNRYTLGDEHTIKGPLHFWKHLIKEVGFNAEVCESFLPTQIKAIKKEVIALPLYLYDHGNITMNTTGFHCRWDSGQVGWIYATKRNFEKAGYTFPQAVQVLQSEVSTYDMYLRGEAYGFILEKKEHSNGFVQYQQEDSCWGFLGSIKETMRTIKDFLPPQAHELLAN